MKVCIDKGTNDARCCKAWAKGIRTINNQYPDDNREFGILEGTGIIITPETAGIRITCTVPTADTITAGDNIDISPGGSDELVISLVSDPVINGNIQINGDIIQNGSAYETHAEKVYTTNDYIVTRDGAISALSAGDYSGFQVKKYDGTNDGRLVIDNAGVARVGDVGDEQPLLTREESADLTDGALLKWDATNQKAIDEGTVGSDTKPVKIVNGVAVPVTDAFIKDSFSERVVNISGLLPNYVSGDLIETIIGEHLVIYTFSDIVVSALTGYDVALTTLPGGKVARNAPRAILGDAAQVDGLAFMINGEGYLKFKISRANTYISGQLIVIC